jgi:hypothetical protein
MAVIGKVDAGLLAALGSAYGGETFARYTITAADAAGPFRDIPAGMEAMAELDVLAYESAAEALAERFHMARAFLEALNPGADFAKAGTEIVVVALQDRALDAKAAASKWTRHTQGFGHTAPTANCSPVIRPPSAAASFRRQAEA